MKPATLRAIQRHIRSLAKPGDAEIAARFHKTGPGEYAEGQVFLGLSAGILRGLSREYRDLPLATVESLLQSPIHDERAVALLILVDRMAAREESVQMAVRDLFLRNSARVDSWALVDCSAPGILGRFLANRPRKVLDRLARSKNLWERRIAIVSTQWLIRQGEFDDTLRIACALLGDDHDLIHKAVGWMLREVGKRDRAVLENFLRENLDALPRTTLRYAIERFPEPLRKAFLRGGIGDRIKSKRNRPRHENR